MDDPRGLPQPQQAMPAGGPVADDAMPDGAEMASPEEQRLYEEIVARAYLLIFDEKTRSVRESILDSLRDDNPKEALGQTAATVFHRVEQEAVKAGMQIPGDVREAAAAEVFEKLAEIATKEGTHDFIADDDAFNGAFFIAADALRVMGQADGTIDQEAAAAEFEEIAAMDRDGRLAQVMEGM